MTRYEKMGFCLIVLLVFSEHPFFCRRKISLFPAVIYLFKVSAGCVIYTKLLIIFVSTIVVYRTPEVTFDITSGAAIQMFYETAITKNFAKFKEKHLCRSLLIMNLQAVCIFVNTRLRHKCYPVNF